MREIKFRGKPIGIIGDWYCIGIVVEKEQQFQFTNKYYIQYMMKKTKRFIQLKIM